MKKQVRFDIQELINNPSSKSTKQLFAEAWLNAQGNSNSDVSSRESLEAFAFDSVELKDVLVQLMNQKEDILELHLQESAIYPHAATASYIGDFIKKMSGAVKDFNKSSLGTFRATDDLLVFAPQLGSLMLKFTLKPHNFVVDTLPGTNVKSISALSLRNLVKIFLIAEDGDSDLLHAAVQNLNIKARRSLGSLTSTIEKAAWSVSGTLYPTDGSPEPIELTQAGIARIQDATRVGNTEEEIRTEVGNVVGWLWNKSAMKFELESGKTLDVYVPEELAQEAAERNTRRGDTVKIKVNVTKFYLEGDSAVARTTYTLLNFVDSDKQAKIKF